MEILVTNDDGIFAEGILFLARKAKKYGHVTVVAPSQQCSAMSHRLTIMKPISFSEVDFPVDGVKAYSIDGTPADCVKVALEVILDRKPDLIFSGMNKGYNIGYDVIYSGTCGAAMEGIMNGIRSIAFSRNDVGTNSVAEAMFDEVMEKILVSEISAKEIWNVNFPGCELAELKGIAWDRKVAHEEYYNAKLFLSESDGKRYAQYPDFGTAASPDYLRGSPDSDLYAVVQRYISVGKVICPVL